MTVRQRRLLPTLGVFVLAMTAAAGCTGAGSRSIAPSASTSTAPATSAPPGTGVLRGAHVHVLGLWSGPEYDSFAAVKSAWEKTTGGVVDWEGTQDLPTVLGARISNGNEPDIAVLPNVAVMRQLAAKGRLVPLDSVLDMGQVRKDYSPPWIGLGSYHRRLYGIFYKVTSKATVWYDPSAFAAAHYRVPKTWASLIALADRMVADGHAPFSVVAASGPASGWPLTDWVSQIVLNKCGTVVYDQWIAADIPWTQSCVKQSFTLFDKLVQTDGYVLGGNERILSTTDSDGADPLYATPPGAYLYPLASFAQAFIAANFPTLKPGRDYDFFPFPSIDPRYTGGVTIGADIPVLLGDTPAARSFMTYLASARAQETWIRLGGFTSVNRSVPSSTYADPVARGVSEQLTRASAIRFSAGDMMAATLQRNWWAAMLRLVQHPNALDSVLASLTAVARSAR